MDKIYTIENLLEDIRNLGYPVIELNSSSLSLKILPHYHYMNSNSISFWINDKNIIQQQVAILSFSSIMIPASKPLNCDIKCKKCILIKNAETKMQKQIHMKVTCSGLHIYKNLFMALIKLFRCRGKENKECSNKNVFKKKRNKQHLLLVFRRNS